MKEEKEKIAFFYRNFGDEQNKLPAFIELNLNEKSRYEILELLDKEINKIISMK